MANPHRPISGSASAAGPHAAAGIAVAGLAFDLDGTIYLASQLLPGARALIDALAAEGVPYLFATNNSSRSAEHYVHHLQALGIPADRDAVVTSNDVACAFLHGEGRRRPYLLATPEVEEEYRAQGIEPTDADPDSVLLTFDTTLSYEKLRVASGWIRRGLPYFATHPDRVCPTPDGPIPDCGSFIALLAEATGVRPVVLGKPEAHMANTIRSRLELAAERIAFVGDRLYTDVRMANEQGFQAVLTLTGETTRADLAASPYRPDLVVDTLDVLHDHLRRGGTLRTGGTRPAR